MPFILALWLFLLSGHVVTSNANVDDISMCLQSLNTPESSRDYSGCSPHKLHSQQDCNLMVKDISNASTLDEFSSDSKCWRTPRYRYKQMCRMRWSIDDGGSCDAKCKEVCRGGDIIDIQLAYHVTMSSTSTVQRLSFTTIYQLQLFLSTMCSDDDGGVPMYLQLTCKPRRPTPGGAKIFYQLLAAPSTTSPAHRRGGVHVVYIPLISRPELSLLLPSTYRYLRELEVSGQAMQLTTLQTVEGQGPLTVWDGLKRGSTENDVKTFFSDTNCHATVMKTHKDGDEKYENDKKSDEHRRRKVKGDADKDACDLPPHLVTHACQRWEMDVELSLRYLSQIVRDHSPSLSLTTLHVWYNDTCLDIRSRIDHHLVKHLTRVATSRSHNTLTLLISDHGRFTSQPPLHSAFLHASLSNPAGWLVMPKGGTTPHLPIPPVGPVTPSNLMAWLLPWLTGDMRTLPPIPSTPCHNLTPPTSTVCVCEGKASPATADIYHVGLAEFALAWLNENQPDDCQPLIAFKFDDVMVWREGQQIHTNLTLHLVGLKLVNVEVAETMDDTSSRSTRLVSKHSGCVAEGGRGGRREVRGLWSSFLDVPSRMQDLDRGCLMLVVRDYHQTAAFGAENRCSGNEAYKLKIDVRARNVVSSVSTPVVTSLSPHTAKFVMYTRQANFHINDTYLAYITSFYKYKV